MEHRYHITKDGTIHKGPSDGCKVCEKLLANPAKKRGPKKKPSSNKKKICKVKGCGNTLGPTNASGYCRSCFLRSPEWKATQKKSLKRVRDR